MQQASDKERTLRTLLNMHLVTLYRKGQHVALADHEKRAQFIAHIVPQDERLSEVIQRQAITYQLAQQLLDESLQALIQADGRQLMPIKAPVPPNMESLLCYPGQARYIGFRWHTKADELWWEDGICGQIAKYWAGYFIWLNAWIVDAGLGGYRSRLGHSGCEPTHELILDRDTRMLYVATRQNGELFLREQWPEESISQIDIGYQVPSQEDLVIMQQEAAQLQSWLGHFWPIFE